ncbi:ArsR/SmtB family transcription factor [Phytohabitans suffuscus]|uniref:ArsR/SmtB family transcription factor n=1 Tax=Phytohabitans suffuscus TaxID=624315 RepID=UPI001E5FC1E0|nr:winged helix-turn-helix domain-containing protein [Phytohabitans suffuscus]
MAGLSPSATSYHLRALARYGLVEQAPSRGDGRERVWRAPCTRGRWTPARRLIRRRRRPRGRWSTHTWRGRSSGSAGGWRG